MEALLYQVFSGLANGIIYGSVALALVMIYQATHHINFAQGEMATFSTFIAWALINEAGWSYWTAFFFTVAVSFAGGLLVQRIILKPIEKAPVLTNVIVFIGLLLIFNALSGMFFDHTIKSFASPFPKDSFLDTKYFSAHQVGSAGVLLVVLFALFAFFKYTSVGLAMRAAAQNPDSAKLVGIRVSWMLGLGWGLAAAIGAVAGMMVAPIVFLDPNMMAGILLYGFAGALLGGIDNPPAAVLGGLVVGVLENLLGAYVIGTELKLTVALVLIVGTLTLRPDGLFGKKVVTRV
jgi:branched-chain amino acid transport system permease protein